MKRILLPLGLAAILSLSAYGAARLAGGGEEGTAEAAPCADFCPLDRHAAHDEEPPVDLALRTPPTLPPLDAAAPPHTKRATFALG